MKIEESIAKTRKNLRAHFSKWNPLMMLSKKAFRNMTRCGWFLSYLAIHKEDMLWGGVGIRCEIKGLRGVGRRDFLFCFLKIFLILRI